MGPVILALLAAACMFVPAHSSPIPVDLTDLVAQLLKYAQKLFPNQNLGVLASALSLYKTVSGGSTLGQRSMPGVTTDPTVAEIFRLIKNYLKQLEPAAHHVFAQRNLYDQQQVARSYRRMPYAYDSVQTFE